MQWISVTDILPCPGVEVLATDGEIIRVATRAQISFEKGYSWTEYDCLEWHNVTHWMPLPDEPSKIPVSS